jgi:hypothetical protein
MEVITPIKQSHRLWIGECKSPYNGLSMSARYAWLQCCGAPERPILCNCNKHQPNHSFLTLCRISCLDILFSLPVAHPAKKIPSISSGGNQSLGRITQNVSTYGLYKISGALWIHQDGRAYTSLVDHPRGSLEWCHGQTPRWSQSG